MSPKEEVLYRVAGQGPIKGSTRTCLSLRDVLKRKEGTGQAFALHLKMMSLGVWPKASEPQEGCEDHPVMDTAVILYIFSLFHKNC